MLGRPDVFANYKLRGESRDGRRRVYSSLREQEILVAESDGTVLSTWKGHFQKGGGRDLGFRQRGRDREAKSSEPRSPSNQGAMRFPSTMLPPVRSGERLMMSG